MKSERHHLDFAELTGRGVQDGLHGDLRQRQSAPPQMADVTQDGGGLLADRAAEGGGEQFGHLTERDGGTGERVAPVPVRCRVGGLSVIRYRDRSR